LSFTGFVINGAAGPLTPAAEAIYSSFSPDGIVITANKDPQGADNSGRVTAEGMPVMHHVSDLPGGDVAKAAAVVVAIAKPGAAKRVPQFMVFRTILQPASFHDQVATAASEAVPEIEWVDPVTLGKLVKVHATGGL
jgi:hypothetical protein